MPRTHITFLLVCALAAFSCVPPAGRSEPGTAIAAPATPGEIDPELNERIDRLLIREERKDAQKSLIAEGSRALPTLISRLDDPEFTVRWEMVNIMGYIGDPAASPAVAYQATRDVNPHIRWRGFWSLSSMDGDQPQAELKKFLDDADPIVRWNAAVGLAMFEDPDVLPLMIEGLQQDDEWRRWEAVNSLRQVGDETVIPQLEELIQDEDLKIRQEAVMATSKIRTEAATAVLVKALEDESPQVRWRAVMGLGRRMDDALAQTLKDLRAGGEADPQVLEQIEKSLSDD